MGKTLTIADDDIGATASVRIEQRNGQPVVTELRFVAADGHGLSSAALGLMEDLGLRLPERPPPVTGTAAPRKPAARKPAKKTAAAKKPARPTAAATGQQPGEADSRPALPPAPPPDPPQNTPAEATPAAPAQATPAPASAPKQRKTYRTGSPPTPAELRESFRTHRGDYHKMAEQFGCGLSTVNNWVRRARENGTPINLEGLALAAEAPS